jgi:hypothetical protein
MSHLKVIRSPSVQDLRSLSFDKWLVSKVMKVNKKAASLIAVATFLITHFSGLSERLRESHGGLLLPFVGGAQMLVIFVLIVMAKFTFVSSASSRPAKGGRGSRRGAAGAPAAQQAGTEAGPVPEQVDVFRPIRHYRNNCLAIWLCWLGLYLVFAIKFAPGVSSNKSLTVGLTVLTTFLNNCATLATLYCYLTLKHASTPRDGNAQGDTQADWFLWGGTLIMLTGVEVLCVALTSTQVLSGWLVVEPTTISNVFGWISGISAATVLALHTSCLTHEALRCPTWVVASLFAYAGLQTAFVTLGNEHHLATLFLLNLALLLKTLLYFYLWWAFRYGWLLNYFSTRQKQTFPGGGTGG